MMRKLRIRKPMPIDFDHMRMLHQEAMEQLDLMRTAVEAAEQATDRMRDNLDDIAANHWHGYMDVMHLICMHDDAIAAIMNKHGIKLREADTEADERQFGLRRTLLLLLVMALLRRHRRMEYVFSLRGGPMTEYLQESCAVEREHIAELISMINSMV